MIGAGVLVVDVRDAPLRERGVQSLDPGAHPLRLFGADAQPQETHALRESGPDTVLNMLKEMPRAGSIASTGSVGQEIHFARRVPGPNNSERVILITDRRLTFWELQSGSRTVDYPFTLVEIRIGADGKGEGKASTATKVIVDRESKTVVLENWATQPVALQNVTREK